MTSAKITSHSARVNQWNYLPQKPLKKQITIRLDTQALDYFKELSVELGIPYQTSINLYLRDCASTGKRLSIKWRTSI